MSENFKWLNSIDERGIKMEYAIYKLEFQTGVHFGTGMLNESAYTFQADQLFSALYIEALKLECADQFYEMVCDDRILFSDAFPYIKQKYMVPKPMIYVKPLEQGISEKKKLFKKIKYIPIELLDDFINGKLQIESDPMRGYGKSAQQTMANVRNDEDTLPYRVGTYYYNEGCGLYIIVAYEDEIAKYLMEDLLEALSYTGIGGKKSSGLGKFILKTGKVPEILMFHLKNKTEKSMLLSTALPKEQELELIMENASYQLIRRSGYVASEKYADEWRKKKDLYVFSAGSCFEKRFIGDIYNVALQGTHPVYRYAKGLFMGV